MEDQPTFSLPPFASLAFSKQSVCLLPSIIYILSAWAALVMPQTLAAFGYMVTWQ